MILFQKLQLNKKLIMLLTNKRADLHFLHEKNIAINLREF